MKLHYLIGCWLCNTIQSLAMNEWMVNNILLSTKNGNSFKLTNNTHTHTFSSQFIWFPIRCRINREKKKKNKNKIISLSGVNFIQVQGMILMTSQYGKYYNMQFSKCVLMPAAIEMNCVFIVCKTYGHAIAIVIFK